MNKIIIIFILTLTFFVFCYQVFAAEVLQVSSSSVLLLGDNNRTYTVKLACAEIDSGKEELAINWLRKELPRHTKVNLRPKGVSDGVLIAKVIPLNSDIDISEKYISEGLAESKC
tara:strand:+ start:138 stop:482 length:345 start_codon:yes stop_codon:yes gene_type:complete